MTAPETDSLSEDDILRARVEADWKALGFNISPKYIDQMAQIISRARGAETAGDVRDLLGGIVNESAGRILRSLPVSNETISDDVTGWRLRRDTARALATDAFETKIRHAHSPRMIPYCADSIPRPATPPTPGRRVTGANPA